MNTEHTSNKANVTHIYPKMPFVLGDDQPQKPISDERESDAWYELRELTYEEAPGCILVATHEVEIDSDNSFREMFEKQDTIAGRLRFAPNFTSRMELTKDGKTRTKEELIPWNLGIRQCAAEVIERYSWKFSRRVGRHRDECSFDKCAEDCERREGEPLLALVLWNPEEWCHLKYLDRVVKACPDLPIYIFHTYHIDKYGVEREAGAGSWQARFHTKTEALVVPENDDIVVRGLCNVGKLSMWGALPKHGKSYLFLSIMKALLSGKPWLNHFEVSQSKRVVYLVPEVGLRGVMKRLRKLRMVDYLYDPVTNPDGTLFVQTLSSRDKLRLDDASLLQAVQGADVFVDPLIRYIEGEENNASDQRLLSNKLLALISAEARSVWCSHHSPKAFKDVTAITTQNVLRGTGEFAAFPDIIFGVLKTDDEAARLYIKCTDARDDDEYLGDFEIEMRPWIDETGDMKLVVPPGTGTPLREQRREDIGSKREKALAMIKEGRGRTEICKTLKIGTHTFKRWYQEQLDFDTNQEEEV